VDPGFFATVYTARALRRLRPDPIPDEVLFQILDAAIRAPSGQNAQDWRFVVVRDPAAKLSMQGWAQEGWQRYRAAYAARPGGIEGLPRTQRLSLRSVEHLAHHLSEAPVVVVVCGLRGRHSTPGGSAFPAVQNMLLAARAVGVGGSIFNLPLRPELQTMLEIPENNQVYCLVPLGYPRDRFGALNRKPVRKVVFAERWGSEWPFAAGQPDAGWTGRWAAEP
jgi:nitroreductase